MRDLQGAAREEVARILEIVAADGLPNPRDLDVALDAIGNAVFDGADDPIAAIEQAADGKYWQMAKGNTRIGETMFGAALVEPRTDKIVMIGKGHNMMSAIRNLSPSVEK